MEPFVFALVAHGLIGGADVIVNHELIARIPAQVGSRAEQRLHSARELIFAVMFLALAWWEWHGLLAVAIILLLLAEFAASTIDTIVELDTRILPVTERCAHVLLFVNFGILIALLGQALLTWGQQPTGLVATSYGALSWLLSILGALALALGWSVRDAIAALRREPVGLPSTAPDHPRALSRG